MKRSECSLVLSWARCFGALQHQHDCEETNPKPEASSPLHLARSLSLFLSFSLSLSLSLALSLSRSLALSLSLSLSLPTSLVYRGLNRCIRNPAIEDLG